MEVQASEFFTNLSKIFNEETGKNYKPRDIHSSFVTNWLWQNNTPMEWKVPNLSHIIKAYEVTFGRDELKVAEKAGKVFRNLSKVSKVYKTLNA